MAGRKIQMHFLETVVPPFTNSSVALVEDGENPDIVNLLKKSKLYMIAGRAKASFVNHRIDEEKAWLHLDVQVGEEIVDSGYIDLSRDLNFFPESESYSVGVEDGQVIVISKEQEKILWLTPDSLYWFSARGDRLIVGFGNFKKVCSYELLYVGISKKRDSYIRLVEEGHKKRLRILSRERPRMAGANVSDEIILFFYDIEPFRIATDFGFSDEFSHYSDEDHRKVVADAEKAFVSLMLPRHNEEQFQSYPEGQDGLSKSELESYSYSINENFTFNTIAHDFKGQHNPFTLFDNRRDSIIIKGDSVEVLLGSTESEGLEPERVKIIR